MGKTLQAIKIKLIPKGMPAPETAIRASTDAYVPHLKYSAHMGFIGWQNQVSNGATAGVPNIGQNLEAIRFSLEKTNVPGNILGKAHVAFIGWQGSCTHEIGTTGESRAIEAVEFEIMGELAQKYRVSYRVNSQYYGWSK